MALASLLFEKIGSVACLTLNRPAQRNAFTGPMIDLWVKALHTCMDDDAIKAVVLTGAGGAFCSGGDIGSMAARTQFTALDHKDWLWRKVHSVARAVAELDKPLIAAVDGVAYGAGMDMALMCDIRFASTKAKFSESYIKLGLVPGDGGAYFLPRVVGVAKALELLWTGEQVDAAEAARIGLVSRVLEPDELLPRTMEFARSIAAQPSAAVRITKRAAYQGLTSSMSAALDAVSSHIAVLRSSPEYEAAIEAFNEGRSARAAARRSDNPVSHRSDD
jgi:2-(1,2-epoxy-1,2-dihydrophenyl)acetyl-CoA isomerase